MQKYHLNSITQELKICIPIVSGWSSLSSIHNMLESVVKQKYDNYHIFIYTQNEEQLNMKDTAKIDIIHGQMGQLKECSDFDIVLMVREG